MKCEIESCRTNLFNLPFNIFVLIVLLTYLIISLIVNSMCLRTSEISLEPCEVQPSNKNRCSAPNRHSAPKEFVLNFSKAI